MSQHQTESTIGSQRLLQLAVNHRPELLRSALKKSGALQRRESVIWKSPLVADNYREFRDKAALEKLELQDRLSIPLRDFWPSRGAVWDGLGVTSKSRAILVEAKAHIPEAVSPGSQASPASLALIERSLLATRRYLAPRSRAVWTGTFYQYANRLSYQYFLRVVNDVESCLIFLDFTNAEDMNGPRTEDEWRGATRVIHTVLGIPDNLERFGVYHAYIDARQLTDAA